MDNEGIESIRRWVEKGAARILDTPYGGVLVHSDGTDSTAITPLVEIFQQHLAHPERAKGFFNATDLDSFIDYVLRFTHDNVFVTVDKARGLIRAYFNATGRGALNTCQPGHGDWGATFTPRLTTAWTAWLGLSGTAAFMGQEAFADHLEQRIDNIVVPDAGALLSAVRDLRMSINTTFERQANGTNDTVQLIFREEATVHSVEIPRSITISVAPFDGADPIVMIGRLRWSKPQAGKGVGFRFDLDDQPRRVMDAALDGMADRIRADTDLLVVMGTL